MNHTIAIENIGLATGCEYRVRRGNLLIKKLAKSASLLLIAAMFLAGSIISLTCDISVKNVMGSYSYDVLVILIVMELFTNLIAETGIMQLLAIKIAELSKGQKRLCLMMFGGYDVLNFIMPK